MSGVIVKEKVLAQDLYYKDQRIMSYTIKYPYFQSVKCQLILSKLNLYYRSRAKMYEKTDIMRLYQLAMVEYEYAVANNFPFRQFEAYVDYNVTYNQDDILSLYFDKYEYTGGAHGMTYRSSDTWDIIGSRRIELCELFPEYTDCREHIISIILGHIKEEMNSEEAFYFEDYEERVRETFRLDNYYISKEGVISYFQQYDIAPYAFGIPEFILVGDDFYIYKC